MQDLEQAIQKKGCEQMMNSFHYKPVENKYLP